MPDPITIAAIDAGSNAIRVQISRAFAAGEATRLLRERVPVRLGHKVFLKRRFDDLTIDRAVEAFQQFRTHFDNYRVDRYRAVATSATRTARNRDHMIELVRRLTGIELEVIDGAEESRLVRTASLNAVRGVLDPKMIVDLGGGSLEVNLLENGRIAQSVSLPIGTVRLMEMFRTNGAMDVSLYNKLHKHIEKTLLNELGDRFDIAGEPCIACGGNAEAFAKITPGDPMDDIPVLDAELLDDRLWLILAADIKKRMKSFSVRRDRADVMAIAGIVFTTLADFLGIDRFVVPGVGLREGILHDLADAYFQPRRGAWSRSGSHVWSPPAALRRETLIEYRNAG